MSASPLQTGEAVSVSRVVGSKQEQVGIIVNNSPAGITLEFLRHIALLHLDRKDPVRIKFWDKDAIYSWQGEILEALSPAGGSVIVSRPRAIKSERRGFQRFPLEIPLSFSVLFPGEQPSVAGKVFDATTKIISAGAAEFQTAVSLEKREILEMKLHLSASQKIHIIGRSHKIRQTLRKHSRQFACGTVSRPELAGPGPNPKISRSEVLTGFPPTPEAGLKTRSEQDPKPPGSPSEKKAVPWPTTNCGLYAGGRNMV